jgi:ribosomal peptide maturation radical SAM protein 1
MADATTAETNLADPVRLELLHVLFRIAQDELAQRTKREQRPPARTPPHEPQGAGSATTSSDAVRLSGALGRHMSLLDDSELRRQHDWLARAFLLEVDRRMATPGTLPGERVNFDAIRSEVQQPIETRERRIGLVSLPWMSPAMPSIQLATLASALKKDGLGSDVHELYVDYAARIGLNLYSQLDNLLGFLPEWIFSRHYFGPEQGDDLSSMIDQAPLGDLPWPELAESILEALEPVTREFLDDVIQQVDWSIYDIVGCSLTISQLGASMAFARRLKLAYPAVRIVFGGSQCAGPMGSAILRICPYVDAVVHIEGELVLADLVRRFRAGKDLTGLPGVSYRTADGQQASDHTTELVRGGRDKLVLNYDPYFDRIDRLGLSDKVNPWLPFESSRGCWYGQKVQCTFCGLHEIMEFRAWEADPVLAELEKLQKRYGVGRFYCMDLIMPREYLRTLLPEVVKRGHDWMFFYEIKANVRRSELELLAAAGVRWVQPGIESLDADLLRLMRKGVRPYQNIVLLKWSQELGIYCGWNLLFGLPGETQASYTRMAELIPKLVHLRPPSGGGQFQLHRFSPYFEQPEAYGIRWTGAHPMFRYAFPVPQTDLDELVYLHDFTLDPAYGAPADTSGVETAVRKWRQAFRSGATLVLGEQSDGSGVIVDRRDVQKPPVHHRLSAPQADLYRYVDAGVGEKQLAESFMADHPEAFEALGREHGINSVIANWLADDIVVAVDGKILALALQTARMQQNARLPSAGLSELPYADVLQEER